MVTSTNKQDIQHLILKEYYTRYFDNFSFTGGSKADMHCSQPPSLSIWKKKKKEKNVVDSRTDQLQFRDIKIVNYH